jgi:acyl-coenzyme A synthetase/AMP-(fatty) acid ligase
VINVSGHRIGTAEVESAIVLDHRVRLKHKAQ